jgi:hypothetical protein
MAKANTNQEKRYNKQNTTVIKQQYYKPLDIKKYLHVNFHDDENMKQTPIKAVVRLRNASERLVVAAFFMIWVSSDSLLRSSPVRVTS